MSESTKMTKREARAFIRRASEAIADLNKMLSNGGTMEDWSEACNEALGAVSHIQEPVYDGRDINGITR